MKWSSFLLYLLKNNNSESTELQSVPAKIRKQHLQNQTETNEKNFPDPNHIPDPKRVFPTKENVGKINYQSESAGTCC